MPKASTITMAYNRSGRYVEQGREHDDAVDLATVSRADLRWYYFMSDIVFTIGDVDLTPPWSWTPVFDFLWSMKGVLRYLDRGERSTIGFNENAELIEFRPEGEFIRVSCTYTTDVAVCRADELARAWLTFTQSVCAVLAAEYPALAANLALAGLLDAAEPDPPRRRIGRS
ncbi:hypothetical protein ACLMAL_17965 [Nocardia sp. CWNU-33]|uniref:hypothetical protein n=1 Tax=Nocardia sp. CWNU-33 TaxID=3392117 RepID=UPI00398ED24A